jgi:hypothetical protein
VDDAMPRTARECYKWLLCPGSNDPGLKEATIEPFQVNTAGDELVKELERICTDNELVISRWSAMHLRSLLIQYYWKAERPAVGAGAVLQDTLKYLYLPRLRSHEVFEQAIQQGVATEDFFGTALGEKDGRFEGFQLGVPHVHVDDTLLLIEPVAAKAFRASQASTSEDPTTPIGLGGVQPAAQPTALPGSTPTVYPPATPAPQGSPSSPKMKSFHGTVEVTAATARARLLQIAEEVISQLVSDPMAKVSVNVEISAEFPQGAAEQVRRAVSENATNLKFKVSEWEK